MLYKQTIKIHSSEAYTVSTGEDILNEFSICIRNLDAKRAFFVIDEQVTKLQPEFVQNLKNVFETEFSLIVPQGERSKSLKNWSIILDFCLKNGITRKDPLIAIGGGVVGDLVGFAASSVLRGVPLIHVPTTLLAMVDSSIGGKTGVNHPTGKNLIGSFYQPAAVFSDLNTLQTLPDDEFLCGFGEILKYGAIADPAILEILKTKELIDLRQNVPQLESIIQRCIKIKADIVSKDTKESGERVYLNYGHTFAHALENKLGYGTISHGQAVYIGMITAGILSQEFGGNINKDLLETHANSMNLSSEALQVSAADLIHAMRLDKKKKDNTLRFVLLQKYGRPYLKEIDNLDVITQAWEQTCDILSEFSTP